MNKAIYLLSGAVVAFAFSAMPAMAGSSCTAISDQMENVFSDIHNKISEENRTQISLLKDCAAQHMLCVIVEASAPKWLEIIKGNTTQDFSRKVIGDRHAISLLTFVPIQTGRGRCVLSRFGGGTASVWTIDAWEITGGKARTLNTDRTELRGEFKSPEELIRESEKVVRSLR